MSSLLTRRQTTAWLLVCAVGVRLGAFLIFRRIFDFPATGVVHGSVAYDEYARNLVSTGVYGLARGVPDAVLPPLYGALLAAVYRIAGRGALQMVLLNATCDLLALLAIRRVGARLFAHGDAVGTLAAAFTAFYPYLVFQSLTVVDTSLFVALLYLFLAMVIDLRDAGDASAIWRRGALCGVVLGLATLTRPITPPLVAFIALWLAVTLGLRPMFVRLLPVTLVAALVVAPWIVRNTRTFGRLVALTTDGGFNFWMGNNPETVAYLRAGYDPQWTSPPPIAAADRLGPAADAEFFHQTIAYLSAHRGEIPSLVWTKLRVQWSIDVAPRANPSSEGPHGPAFGRATARIDASGAIRLGGLPQAEPVVMYSQPLFDRVGRSVHKVYWGSLFVLGFLGLGLTCRRWRDVSMLWCLPIALTIVYVMTHPSTRYRVPGDPEWFLFSSAALLQLSTGWTRRSQVCRPRTRHRAARRSQLTACWVGSTQYARPLDPAIARKWSALSDLPVQMHVVALSDGPWSRHFTEHATFHLLPNIPFAPVRHATMLIVTPVVLLWLAIRHDARVLIAQSPLEGAMAAWVKVVLTAFGHPIALIVESHGDFEGSVVLYRRVRFGRLARSVRRRLAIFALRHADLGRAVSMATRLQLQRAAPQLPIEIFPAWIDVQALVRVERPLPPSASRDILFAGALVPIKGLHVLVEAFALVTLRAKSARLIVAGPERNGSYVTALRTRIAELGLTARVMFVGERRAPELGGLMASARVVVVPSLSEGLSRVALEAMLVGTPVVASDVGGLPEIVRAGETGWLVPPGDPVALAEALTRAFEDRGVDVLGASARDAARRSVSVEAYVAGHGRLLTAAAARLLGG